MNLDELEAMLVRLTSLPLKSQIKIDFDREKKIFRFTVPIFRTGKKPIPLSIQKYVEARQGMKFQPYETSYALLDNEVQVVQEVPFKWGFQPTLRAQVLHFWHLAKRCHQMFMEISSEETLESLKKIEG